MKFGKRELIMSALVVSLGTAVYINWQFSANDDKLNTSSDNELGVAQYVNAGISSNKESSEKSESNTSSKDSDKVNASTTSKSNSSQEEKDSGSGTSSALSSVDEYFAKVRLERQQTQDELIELAQEIVEATDSSGKGKEEAVKHLSELSDTIQQQSNVENLIIAKGFDDCVAFIQNGECSVVVTGQELKSDLLIAIKDIVVGQTGISFDKIRVTHI